MRLIKLSEFAGPGARELFESLGELGGGAAQLSRQLASRARIIDGPDFSMDVEARGPARVLLPRAWEAEAELGRGSALIEACGQAVARAEIDRRQAMRREGRLDWAYGEILAGLPASWLNAADSPASQALFEAALDAGIERARVAQSVKDEANRDRARARALFIDSDKKWESALEPMELSPEMLKAQERFYQLDQELAEQKKAKPESLALLRWLSLKARGLESAQVGSQGEAAGPGAASERSWREARGLRVSARCAFAEGEVYADNPAGAQEACQRAYMWVKNGGDHSGSYAIEGFDNPLAMALWLIERRGSIPALPSKTANFIATPEGDQISANHGYAWGWAERLIRSIEKEELGLSSAPGKKRAPKSI